MNLNNEPYNLMNLKAFLVVLKIENHIWPPPLWRSEDSSQERVIRASPCGSEDSRKPDYTDMQLQCLLDNWRRQNIQD